MANEAIYKYLADTNRPYSSNDIMLNLHKEYGKTAVQKALDQLTEAGRIREKTYGKQKVYCVVQPEEKENCSQNVEQDMKDLEAEVARLAESLKTVERDAKATETQTQELLAQPATAEASAKVEELEKRTLQLRDKLKELSENMNVVSKAERDAVRTERDRLVKEYRKRKRMCMDVVDAIMDGYPKDKKTLVSEIGIETDEEVKMPPFSQ